MLVQLLSEFVHAWLFLFSIARNVHLFIERNTSCGSVVRATQEEKLHITLLFYLVTFCFRSFRDNKLGQKFIIFQLPSIIYPSKVTNFPSNSFTFWTQKIVSATAREARGKKTHTIRIRSKFLTYRQYRKNINKKWPHNFVDNYRPIFSFTNYLIYFWRVVFVWFLFGNYFLSNRFVERICDNQIWFFRKLDWIIVNHLIGKLTLSWKNRSNEKEFFLFLFFFLIYFIRSIFILKYT